MTNNIGEETPEAFRDAMVAELREMGSLRSESTIRAFRAVPRHLFCPDSSLMQAYAVNDSVVVKRDVDGAALSTVSAPAMQADMLEQAGIEPGMRVLEIGSGGVNAAMIAELVGSAGQVTTVDIDPDVVERARHGLVEAGYPQVTVCRGDAEHGIAEHAPYDRILVTVGAWDIPPAWVDQLAADGKLIVPLQLNGVMRSVALDRDDDRLVSRSIHPCGFVPMQGAGAREEPLVMLEPEVALRFEQKPPLDIAGLRNSLHQRGEERWSGLAVGPREMIDDLTLWLVTTVPGCGVLTATQAAADRGLVGRPARRGVPTLIRSNSFAYRATVRPTDDGQRVELGVHGHGPRAAELADSYVALMRQWDQQHRPGPGARIEIFPTTTPDAELPPGFVLTKPHTRVVIAWPDP